MFWSNGRGSPDDERIEATSNEFAGIGEIGIKQMDRVPRAMRTAEYKKGGLCLIKLLLVVDDVHGFSCFAFIR
jgi:hypothetical protein